MSGERGERDVLAEWEEMKADEHKYRLTSDHEWYQGVAFRLATELRAARAERDQALASCEEARSVGRLEAGHEKDGRIFALEAERDALQARLDGGVRGWAKDNDRWEVTCLNMEGIDGWHRVLIFTDDNERER